MITPLDIQNKEFKRSFRGYKETEVDQFLDEIIKDYEKVYKDNIELKDKIVSLNDQIDQFTNLEETLKETLVVAQSTANEVIGTAKEKAEVIIEDAEMESKKLIDNASSDVREIRKEYENLIKEMFIFKTRYKSFIEAQLVTLDEFYSKMDNDDINITNNESLEEYIGESKEEALDSQDIEIEEDIDDLGA